MIVSRQQNELPNAEAKVTDSDARTATAGDAAGGSNDHPADASLSADGRQLYQQIPLDPIPETLSESQYRAALTLKRITPAVDAVWSLATAVATVESAETDGSSGVQELDVRRQEFFRRLHANWYELFDRLFVLYSDRFDFHFHVQALVVAAARAAIDRDEALCATDRSREVEPDWFQSQKTVGGALYVDLFSENLESLRQNIDYFKTLGITYLHLMPLFAVRPGNNDGGYAISDYRAVDPRLGTVLDLQQLAADLRAEGIYLVLDFVFNHTSDDHDWAKQAQSGNREYQEFYFIFPDREQPDAYEQNLREIFPTVRRGNFTWHDGMRQWVWTTFNSFQWDLNYRNPAVFRSMLEEMLFIANLGVDVLRLDAVAFIWKQMGTGCENLPEAHVVIQAYNLFVRIAAPGLVFKSEAIVHPDDVVKYIAPNECQISYNPNLMALLWESMATRRVSLLRQALSHRFELPVNTSWVNYLRCHDDIGWTFDNEDAARVGIEAYSHRQFLNDFYTGRFEGSFARGVPFQENLETGDMRVSGTLASLAGLEQAMELDDETLINNAIARIMLLQGVSLSIGGIPLLYLGEEWGMLNDYDFVNDDAKADDTRWIHRPKMDWRFVEDFQESADPQVSPEAAKLMSVQRGIFSSTQRLIALRKAQPALAAQEMDLFETENDHLLGYVRSNGSSRLLVLANFSDQPQELAGNLLRTAGMGRFFYDLLAEQEVKSSSTVSVAPYQILWLVRV